MHRSITSVVALLAVAAVSCASTPAPTTTSDVAPLVELALGPEGLGDVLFGLDPDTVVADITARYGAPDHDSGWIPSQPNVYGTCPGELMRAIGWGSLVTIFIDDGSNDLGGFFYAYTYGYDYSGNTGAGDARELNLETEGGIGLGTPVSEMRQFLGSDFTVTGDSEFDTWKFESPATGIRGLLSGPDDDDEVTLIESLQGCT